MKLKQGPISEDELIQRLANAKKVMSVVDDKSYTPSNNKTSPIDDNSAYAIADKLLGEGSTESVPVTNNLNVTNKERIEQSNLPENIKKAMMDNPINLPLNESLNMSFVEKTKKLMEKEGVDIKSKRTVLPQNNSDLVAQLTPIIENIIRKTIDDILDKKLNQILTAQQTATINENLVLKVGNSIFKGKITGVKKSQ